MFQKQMKKIRAAIMLASKINNLERGIDAFSDIIDEKLITTNKKISISAILFLENDERGDVYYRRSYLYEQLAKKCLAEENHEEATEYFALATSDTESAMKAYDDIEKIKICRKELKEDKERMTTAIPKNEGQTCDVTSQVRSKKRIIEESSSTTSEDNSPKKHNLRNKHRMWSPQAAYENKVAALEQEQKNAYKR